VESLSKEFQDKLHSALTEVKITPPDRIGMRGFAGRWKGLGRYYEHRELATGVDHKTLQRIVTGLTRTPEHFTPHPKIERQLEARQKAFNDGGPIDWSFAEALAFGSLVLEGTPIRLSGQDSRRGTFSQRHAVLYDVNTGESYTPLNSLAEDQAWFSVYDSLLSEAAVLGFEFGYSLDAPEALVLWEAQFGDFANGAQVIIDQFISCSTTKWQRDSGLVMLLPHGYEGQGPEHSSARLERYLQLCADDNMQVAYPSTPAQYFHILRRQIKRDFRKPLILMTPKSLLRHKVCVSSVEELVKGRFHEVLDDTEADPRRVRRVVMCSGKVYYDLLDRRQKMDNREQVALVRMEQFYPFEQEQLRRILHRYEKAQEWVWVQEESANMGAWGFMEPRLREMGCDFHYVGRDVSASPATGSKRIHDREQKELVETALQGKTPHMVRATGAFPGEKKSRDMRVPVESPVGSSS
jgi:2-oxoglutarate dehydrogenase E1 component